MRIDTFIKINPSLLLLIIVAAFVADPVLAEDSTIYPDALGDYAPTRKDKWKESQVVVPVYPREEHLLNVPLPDSHNLKLYLDEHSISRLPDGAIRFSLVVESPSGARNVFYDGIRCETREYKTYAYGTVDGKFQQVHGSVWREFPDYETNAFRKYLSRHIVCDGHNSARLPQEIIRLIKYGS